MSKDPLSSFADIARIVVHTQYAYDIIDELASNPEKFIESVYKLSRLAVKLLNDLEIGEKEVSNEDQRRAVEYTIRGLKDWSRLLGEFIEYLKDLMGKGEKERRIFLDEVRRFATLAISPDRYSILVREVLEKSPRKEVS